jgi:hypothetical protein
VPLLPWRLQDTVRESRVALILLGIALAIAMMAWVALRFL